MEWLLCVIFHIFVTYTIFFSYDIQDTVNSSEDISAKTKSVIELKKLQLLALQRRLRR